MGNVIIETKQDIFIKMKEEGEDLLIFLKPMILPPDDEDKILTRYESLTIQPGFKTKYKEKKPGILDKLAEDVVPEFLQAAKQIILIPPTLYHDITVSQLLDLWTKHIEKIQMIEERAEKIREKMNDEI